MNKLTLVLITLLAFSGTSQVSVDSLMTALNENYHKSGTSNYLQADFTVFKSDDSLDRYDVNLDSNNLLNEYIGLSIVHRAFDSQKRPTITEGFNKSGELSYWDFPPLQKFSYSDDTLVPLINKVNNEICQCDTSNVHGTIRRIVEYDENRVMTSARVTEMTKDGSVKLRYGYRSKTKTLLNYNDLVYSYREYDDSTTYLIVHERFYDLDFKLLENKYPVRSGDNVSTGSYVPYAYSIREVVNGKFTILRFYDANNNLVHKDDKTRWNGPRAMPSPVIKSE